MTAPEAVLQACAGSQQTPPEVHFVPVGQQVNPPEPFGHGLVPAGQPHLPLTQAWPSGQQMTAPVEDLQTASRRQHLPFTQTCPGGQQMNPSPGTLQSRVVSRAQSLQRFLHSFRSSLGKFARQNLLQLASSLWSSP